MRKGKEGMDVRSATEDEVMGSDVTDRMKGKGRRQIQDNAQDLHLRT